MFSWASSSQLQRRWLYNRRTLTKCGLFPAKVCHVNCTQCCNESPWLSLLPQWRPTFFERIARQRRRNAAEKGVQSRRKCPREAHFEQRTRFAKCWQAAIDPTKSLQFGVEWQLTCFDRPQQWTFTVFCYCFCELFQQMWKEGQR